MSEEPHELVIIRRRHEHEDSHHGGAWKIAFADFMTAMMALFLVLWLISTTTPKVKTTIARYFNPVKLVELTPLKKGFNDPVDSDAVPGADGKGQTPTDDAEKRTETAAASDGNGNGMAGKATHTEAALFRDPYAVLAEIAASDAPPAPVASKPKSSEAPVDAPEPFRDPFAPLPQDSASDDAPGIKILQLGTPSKPNNADAATALQFDGHPVPTKGDMLRAGAIKAPEGKKPGAIASDKTAEAVPVARQAADPQVAAAVAPVAAPPAEAARLQGQITKAIANSAAGQPVPTVEVRGTDEGLLISLTDQKAFAMFAIGSAEPQAQTIHAMEAVAKLLSTRPGKVIIRGFTDARPYKSANYDNWRLSSARAHMAQYMLIRGGLDEKRIAAIEGLADRRPKIPTDPMAPENRRIEILIRPDTP